MGIFRALAIFSARQEKVQFLLAVMAPLHQDLHLEVDAGDPLLQQFPGQAFELLF
jgi:hypothetical protein